MQTVPEVEHVGLETRRRVGGGALAPLLDVVDRLNDAAGELSALALLPIVIFTTYEVIARKAGHPSAWTNEVSVYLLAVSGFIGLGAVEKHRSHLAVHFFVELVPARARLVLELVVEVLGSAFAGWMVVLGVQLVLRSMSLGTRTQTLLELPVAAVQMLLPIGMLLFGLQYVVGVFDTAAALRHLRGSGHGP